jgi:hypothetical protein
MKSERSLLSAEDSYLQDLLPALPRSALLRIERFAGAPCDERCEAPDAHESPRLPPLRPNCSKAARRVARRAAEG